MEIINCRNCRRLFNYISGPKVCPACRDAMEQEFSVVKEYVRDNPHCTMREVADATEVNIKQIREWIKEERLELSDAADAGIACERCGKLIKSGRYCDECKLQMTNSLRSAFDLDKKPTAKKQEKKADGMYYFR